MCLHWKRVYVKSWNQDCQEKYQQPQICNDTILMTENEDELKSPMMRVKEKSEKAGLKLSIQKIKIVASGPFISWQTEGEKVETVEDFIFLGCKVSVDGDCSHGIKRHLLLGRKAMTNLGSILKSKDNILPTKSCTVKAMVFPIVLFGCWLVHKEG